MALHHQLDRAPLLRDRGHADTDGVPLPRRHRGGASGTIGSRPAVPYAVVDAATHLGVRHIQMPTIPPRVGKAIADAQGGISR